MLVENEYYRTRSDDVKLVKTYSDSGFLIKKIGTDEVYDIVIDVEGHPYMYQETDKKIEEVERDEA